MSEPLHQSTLNIVNHHPLRSAALSTGADNASITRPHLARLTQDNASDSSLDTNEDSNSARRSDKDSQERLVIVHKVGPKDSLPGVSLRYGIPLPELRRANQLWTSDSIHLRDVLYIPVDLATRAPEALPRQPSNTLNISSSTTIQRVPTSQLSFFPPSRTTKHRMRRRHSLTDLHMPRSQLATRSQSYTRNSSLHSTRLTSLLTALPIAASTRDTIVSRLSLDNISRLSFDDRSGSQSDNEENHELEDVVAARSSIRASLEDYPGDVKTPRNNLHHDLHRSGGVARCKAVDYDNSHRVFSSSPPSSYISSYSAIRTVQMEPSPIMQIPKMVNSTLIRDHTYKDGIKHRRSMTEVSSFRRRAHSSAREAMEMAGANNRLLR